MYTAKTAESGMYETIAPFAVLINTLQHKSKLSSSRLKSARAKGGLSTFLMQRELGCEKEETKIDLLIKYSDALRLYIAPS